MLASVVVNVRSAVHPKGRGIAAALSDVCETPDESCSADAAQVDWVGLERSEPAE